MAHRDRRFRRLLRYVEVIDDIDRIGACRRIDRATAELNGVVTCR
jgi:hypothetical protein